MICFDDEDIGILHDYIQLIREYTPTDTGDYFADYNNERIHHKCEQIEKLLRNGVYDDDKGVLRGT
jgi:hypothetical protein